MSFAVPMILWALPLALAAGAAEYAHRHGGGLVLPAVRRVWAGRTAVAHGGAGRPPRLRVCLWLGLALAVVAMARPQWGREVEPVYDPAKDVIVALDLSRSMLARDVRPSRLEHAKLLVQGMLDKLAGVRVGLVPFAGTSFLQLPLSLDYQVMTESLAGLTPEAFPHGGTHFTGMLNVALDAFAAESGNGRFLVILSDGETSDAQWRPLLPKLKEKRIRVIGVLIGTASGAVIPTKDGGVIKDGAGAEVVSRASGDTLEALVRATEGVLVPASSWVHLADVLQAQGGRPLSPAVAAASEGRPIERYRWALVPALVLLALAYWFETPFRPSARALRLVAGPVARTLERGRTNTLVGAAVALVLVAGIWIPVGRAVDAAEIARGLNKRPSSPADALAILLTRRISDVLSKPRPIGVDYAGIAIDTVAYVETKLRNRERVPLPVVDDALASVALGRRVDATAADWTKLEGDLRLLLEKAKRPPVVYAGPADQKTDIEALLALAEGDDPQAVKRKKPKDDEIQDEIPDDLVDKPARRAPGSAFGNMKADEAAALAGGATEEEREPTRPLGRDDLDIEENPDLALPLHRLEQVRSQDSPARLFQLMEGADAAPPPPGDDW